MYGVAKRQYGITDHGQAKSPRVTPRVGARIPLHIKKDKQPEWTGKGRTQGKYQCGLSGKPALGMTPLSSR